jgi:hypothetical protein
MDETTPPVQTTQQANPPDPQYPPTTAMPTDDHPNAKFKLRWIAVVIGITILALCGGLFIKGMIGNSVPQKAQKTAVVAPTKKPMPTTNPLASWKTYTDNMYLFTMSFPKEWYIYPTSGSKEGKTYPGDTFSAQNYNADNLANKNMKLSDVVRNPVRIDIGIATNNTSSLEQIKNRLIENNGDPGGESIFVDLDKIREIKQDSRPALLVTYKNKAIKQIYILHEKNYLYTIDMYYEPTDANDTVLNQILSTFTFTTPPEITKENPKVSSVLTQLIAAPDRTSFANTNALKLKDNMVFVTLQLADKNFQLPREITQETARYENLVDAYVVIDTLPTLAENPAIRFIDIPSQGQIDR